MSKKETRVWNSALQRARQLIEEKLAQYQDSETFSGSQVVSALVTLERDVEELVIR